MSRSQPTRPPTIYDISEAAGVAASTVSKVLGSRSAAYAISEATRARILTVAQELGYATDPSQRPRRKRRSGVIGVIYGTALPLNHPVYEPIADRLGAAMAAAGYRMQFLPAASWVEVREHLATYAMDGVLLVPYLPPGEPEAKEALNLPMVVFNDQCSLPIPQVVSDDARGVELAIDHLVALGHRRIVYGDIADRPRHHGSEIVRRDAYRAAMAAKGLEAADWCDQPAAVWERARSAGATALLTYNNQLALDLLPVLRQRGVRIPEDLSLVSGTDVRVGSLVEPGLTAVSVPMEAMADRACQELFALLQGQVSAGPRTIIIPPRLVVRGSSGAPEKLPA